jgi:putative proteasome-type protease
MSDTRTNAGVDNVSTFKKMFTWSIPGDRTIVLLMAGNLGTSQAVISLLDERAKLAKKGSTTILKAPSLFQVARLIGETLREVIDLNQQGGDSAESPFGASIIMGGQISGDNHKLFLIYPEGNFIESSNDTPFFQSGETKYGRPILVRAFNPEMTVEEATKLLLVSFDSSLRSNLSVGLPIDMYIYERDSLRTGYTRRFEASDLYYINVASGWGEALKKALKALPDFNLER